MADLARAREKMVDVQIARRGVRDRRILDAMRPCPREAFVEPGYEEFAYDDGPLPIGEGQTDLAALHRGADDRGRRTGPRRQGAGGGCWVRLRGGGGEPVAGRVYSIERHPAWASRPEIGCETRLDNIDLRVGDGTLGWPEAAPFDAILVAAGGPEPPLALKEQLAIGGRLVVPVGLDERNQNLRKLTRLGEDEYEEEDLGAVRFVPLIGEQGWAEDGTRSATSHVPGQARGLTLPQLIASVAEPFRTPTSRSSPRPSTATPTVASCCSAKPATAHPSSTGPAPPSPATGRAARLHDCRRRGGLA
jgi:protein-L-isoaspartate O-methyltransferase